MNLVLDRIVVLYWNRFIEITVGSRGGGLVGTVRKFGVFLKFTG
jgi:hypothetical protein